MCDEQCVFCRDANCEEMKVLTQIVDADMLDLSQAIKVADYMGLSIDLGRIRHPDLLNAKGLEAWKEHRRREERKGSIILTHPVTAAQSIAIRKAYYEGACLKKNGTQQWELIYEKPLWETA